MDPNARHYPSRAFISHGRRVESCGGSEPGGTAMIDDCGESWHVDTMCTHVHACTTHQLCMKLPEIMIW